MWIGEALWFAPTEVGGEALPRGQSPWRMFAAGMTVTLGNPKIMVLYLALLPAIVDLDHVSARSWRCKHDAS